MSDWHYFKLDDDSSVWDADDTGQKISLSDEFVNWVHFHLGPPHESCKDHEWFGEDWSLDHISTTGINYWSFSVRKDHEARMVEKEFGLERDD